jgi:rhodanese-related sulfurtransferase
VTERTTIDELLAAARRRLDRLEPGDVPAAVDGGGVLVDIRSQDQRRAGGVVPGSYWFPRNVLEWRVDPSSPACHPAVSDPDLRVILLCAQGYQTSLAAAGLQDLGFRHATDVVGGFDAWVEAGLPVEPFDPARHETEGGPA